MSDPKPQATQGAVLDALLSMAKASPAAAALAFVGWLFVSMMDTLSQDLRDVEAAVHAVELNQTTIQATLAEYRSRGEAMERDIDALQQQGRSQ